MHVHSTSRLVRDRLRKITSLARTKQRGLLQRSGVTNVPPYLQEEKEKKGKSSSKDVRASSSVSLKKSEQRKKERNPESVEDGSTSDKVSPEDKLPTKPKRASPTKSSDPSLTHVKSKSHSKDSPVIPRHQIHDKKKDSPPKAPKIQKELTDSEDEAMEKSPKAVSHVDTSGKGSEINGDESVKAPDDSEDESENGGESKKDDRESDSGADDQKHTEASKLQNDVSENSDEDVGDTIGQSIESD